MPKVCDHLGLTQWPFTVVPDRQQCIFLADRQQLRADVSSLLGNLARRDSSQIHLFWAWFGAGKTHTLYYIANVAADVSRQPNSNVLHTIYTEFPKTARSFVDLYRGFASALSMDTLIESYLEICTCAASTPFQKHMTESCPDLYNALRVLAMGEQRDQITALRWLRAEPLPLADIRNLGIFQRLSSSETVVVVLTSLISMLGHAARSKGRPGSLVLWIIDEFQQIASTSSRTLDEINTGLHSTFNGCPAGLSLFISFSGRPQKSLPPWFSEALRDRIGRTKVMVLPPMTLDQALEFVKDVLTHYRPQGFVHESPFFPFSEAACKTILGEVEKHGEVKPRAIMQAFGAVLEEADPKLEAKEFQLISPGFAERALANRVVLEASAEE